MYDHLIVALDALGDDAKLTMEFTKSRLLQEEQRKLERNMRQGSNAKSEHGAALVGNTRHKKFGGPSDVRGELTCHRCSKPGHIARYWRSRFNYGQDYARKVVLALDSPPGPVGPGGEFANVVNHEDGFSSDNEVCLVGEANGKVRNMEWLIDSEASSHMSACKEAMREYKPFTPFDISIGDKTRLQVIGSGQVKLQLNVQGKQNKCMIKDVLHVPMLSYNLLSVSAREGHGMETKFSSGECTIRNKNHLIVSLETKKEIVYELGAISCDVQSEFACTAGADLSTCHARFGHANIRGIASMWKNNVVEGFHCSETKPRTEICESCVYGKSHRLPFPKKSSSRASGILDLVHSDVCGPMPVNSMGGSRYFMTLTDDHYRWSDIFCLKNKSEELECFKKWKTQVECPSDRRIRTLRTDNGGEYLSDEFKVYLEKCGIKQ
jgi:Integrase core domain/GAG-pre-integrase domain